MSYATTMSPVGRAQRFRWTGDEFDRASERGTFDGRRVEVVDGDLLELPPMNDPHAQSIQLITSALSAIFPPTQFTLRVQCPMRLGESRPLPDFVVVAGTPRQIVQHPTTALLVIEVSDTTLDFDRIDKARLYAAHGIPDYWIINLRGKCVEVRRNPFGAEVGDPQYGEVRVYSTSQALSPLAAPQAVLKVSDLLP
ncbi:MAG: Uma2 family endonuclease [Phycisphaerales bacterium]|nr:Uma2 family endonuclease [Phycisphaerales bacterium]